MALWIASPPTCRWRTPRSSEITSGGRFAFRMILLVSFFQKSNSYCGDEGERGGAEDRHTVAAVGIVGRAGERRPEQGADAGGRIDAADDPRYRARAEQVHHHRGESGDE